MKKVMSNEPDTADDGDEFIGTCYMQDDGALILRLRATSGPDAPVDVAGVVGSATITYALNDPAYGEILEHVKPIRPG
ncbi:MAG: hypothetical protein C0508_15330, partial [Cyanobacteria bacterium PR.023]|nr:hypothetical protein [Cyanobacteria bacterium PR.023]